MVYLPNWLFKKETTNTDEMKIKDELVLHGITWTAAEKIEYNTIGAFQTSDSNTPGYYIVRWTGIAYTLHGNIYMSCIQSSIYNSWR